MHLIKLEASPATEPRGGWRATIQEQRNEAEAVLEDSPSLRTSLADVVERELGKARRVATLALAEYGEQASPDLGSIRYAVDQVRWI